MSKCSFCGAEPAQRAVGAAASPSGSPVTHRAPGGCRAEWWLRERGSLGPVLMVPLCTQEPGWGGRPSGCGERCSEEGIGAVREEGGVERMLTCSVTAGVWLTLSEPDSCRVTPSLSLPPESPGHCGMGRL